MGNHISYPFIDYTKAMIAEYGCELDAFVGDETNIYDTKIGATLRGGTGLVDPNRAIMRLMADVTREVQKGWRSTPTWRCPRQTLSNARSRVLTASSPTALTRTLHAGLAVGPRAGFPTTTIA